MDKPVNGQALNECRHQRGSELREFADDDVLYRAVADGAVRSVDPYRAVAELMNAARNFGTVAMVDALAVDVEITSPLTVVCAVETEVEPAAQMESHASGHRCEAPMLCAAFGGFGDECASEETAGRVVELGVDPVRAEQRERGAVVEFDTAREFRSCVTRNVRFGEVMKEHVFGAVGLQHSNWRPTCERLRIGRVRSWR